MAAPKGNKFAEGKGRPTKYDSSFDEQAYKLCLLGHTDAELATFFEVEESTINAWKLQYPSFSESIKAGKDVADGNVVQSLYKRANGFSYDEVTYEKVLTNLDGESDDEEIKMEVYKKKVVTKQVVQDTPAMIFWLKNRQKKKWRDKIEQGFTDGEGNDTAITVFQIPDNGRAKSDTTARGVSDAGT